MKNTGTLKLTTPTDREIAMTRVFNAPRELAFEAWTQPRLLKRRLYGPEEYPLAVCEIDRRVGGALRFVWRHRNGKDAGMGMSGVYREISPSARLVFTEVWDKDWTGGEALVTIVFGEHAGKTTLTQMVLYSSRAARDAFLKTDMEHGAAQGYGRLAQLLASRKKEEN
jgi:uncharacterized protein YndB with AHSA1/START domain